jgi:hypothetical protein
MRRKLFTLTLVIVLIMSTVISSYANVIQQEAGQANSETTDLVLDETELDLSGTQISEYEDAADALAKEIKDAKPSEYTKIIKRETRNLEITETIGEIAGDYTEETGKVPNVSVDCDDLIQTYKLDGNTSLEVTPLYISIEEFTLNPETESNEGVTIISKVANLFVSEAYAGTATKSIGARSTKTYYAVGYGYKLLTMSVGMYFFYDGKKAWYKSDFDAYWVKYMGGALIQVQDWSEKKETSGSSYQGLCSGVFGEGLVIEGNLITLSSKYLLAKVSCSKNGVITRT